MQYSNSYWFNYKTYLIPEILWLLYRAKIFY